MKNAILEDLLRLGKEAGLKSFEQVTNSILSVLHVVLCMVVASQEGSLAIFDYNLYNSLRD